MNIRCTPSRLHGEINLDNSDNSNLFLLCAGVLSKEGITLRGIKVDSFTQKLINILEYMGANVSINETCVTVSRDRLFGMAANVNGGDEFEFFVYCALAAVCEKGFTQITGLKTIKRETVDLTVRALTKLRVACSFDDDDELIIWGGNEITGGTADAENNVFLALALTVISCEAKIAVDIHNTGNLASEFPCYSENFNSLNGKAEIIME